METFKTLVALLFASMLTENAVLVRGYTTGLQDMRLATPRSVLEDGCAATALCIVASFSGWLGRFLMQLLLHDVLYIGKYLRPPIFLFIYLIFYFLIYLLLTKVPALKPAGAKYLGLHSAVAFGFLPMGALLIVGLGTEALPEALIFGLGTGAGYLLATELALSLHSRLSLCRVPAFLRGVPISLITMGLISLGLFALLGHDLAL